MSRPRATKGQIYVAHMGVTYMRVAYKAVVPYVGVAYMRVVYKVGVQKWRTAGSKGFAKRCLIIAVLFLLPPPVLVLSWPYSTDIQSSPHPREETYRRDTLKERHIKFQEKL